MKFLILTAVFYFGFLFYQNSLITSVASNNVKVSDLSDVEVIDYSIYHQKSKDIFSMQSMSGGWHKSIYKLTLYSLLDSLHKLPFIRNFLQKTYTMSDWIKLSQAFYFSFFESSNGLQFLWVTPTSDKILSKLTVGQKDTLRFGGIAQLKWSVHDILFIKLSKDRSQMLLSSTETGVKRIPNPNSDLRSLVVLKKEFLANLKHLVKGDSLSWIEANVDQMNLIQEKNSFRFKLDLLDDTKFYKSFLDMSKYEERIQTTGDDISFQINLAQFLKIIDRDKLKHINVKGAQFFLNNKDLFDGRFFLRAKTVGNVPKFELKTSFINPGSSGRFISKLEGYVSQRSMDLSKLNRNRYSISIPFSPMQLFLRRDKSNIYLSNGDVFSGPVVRNKQKALFNFTLLNNEKKDLILPHIERIIRSFHKKRVKKCFVNLSKRDALFKYCPMGGDYSLQGNDVVCAIHGSAQSSHFLDLVKSDPRRSLVSRAMDNLEKLQVSLSTTPRGFSLELSL